MSMLEEHPAAQSANDRRVATWRDVLAIGFRQRRLMVITFVVVFSIAALIVFLRPTQYKSEMKILVRHGRADSVVTPERDQPVQFRAEVTEGELESEAELLTSKDLLTKVVIACDLQRLVGREFWSTTNQSGDTDVPRAVVKLAKDLTVKTIKLTNLIRVTYRAPDPQLAARVLNTLASLYLEKHLALHRAPGELDFFHQQADEYRKALADAEARLARFGRDEGVVDATLEKDIVVRKLTEFEAESKAALARLTETRSRIRSLEAQLATLPSRQTTQVRTADNPQLMERLKSTLLELELKRTALLQKFEPTYRPVLEIQEQIAQAKEAIAAAESRPLRDETTDRDPTYETLRAELAKAKTELAASEARAATAAGLARAYRAESQRLGEKELLHRDIVRTAKSDEDNYTLYHRKQEEARIADALDRQRISNVVVAEPATPPFAPQSRGLVAMLFGGIIACLSSALLAFVVDYWDPSFRTAEEVESFLGIPVVASFTSSAE